jgi:signal transduction histidine kinase
VVWLAGADGRGANRREFTMRLAGPPPLFAGIHSELLRDAPDAGPLSPFISPAGVDVGSFVATEGEAVGSDSDVTASKALRVDRLPGPGGSTLSLAWTEALADAPLHHSVEAPYDASERAVVVAVGDPERPAGFVELSGGPDLSGQMVATARRAITVAAGAATLLAGALGLVFSRSLTAPLASLAEAARRMESGDLSARVESGGPEEIDSLARAFNGMAGSLETTVSDLAADRDALSRFVADASHQLRTPITALATYLQLVADRVENDATGLELVEQGQTQVARLEWVTSNLLDLSRLDAGVTRLLIEQVDADDLLAAAAGPFKARARMQGTRLDVEPTSGLVLACDRAHVEMAIGNLLDNALKQTTAGDAVTLSAARGVDGIAIVVRDTGPGFVGVDVARVFDRFYRGSTAGAGLGLAVVAGVAAAHGGAARARTLASGGAEVAILLPA